MTKPLSLSQRGQIASRSAMRVDLEVYAEAIENLYHPTKNPEGALILNMAENNLSWPLLREKIETVALENGIPNWVSNYTSALGAASFREALAGFLSKFLCHCPISPDHLACSAGATPVIELTSWILADAGDVAVFPAPSYPVYTQDIGNKAAVERFDLVIQNTTNDRPTLNSKHLDETLTNIESQGKKFRMLILTSPDNPTGYIYSFEQLIEISDWCIEQEVHLIVNEIYGLSLIDTNHPELRADYQTEVDFVSFAQIMQDRQSDYLHLWYSLSKDLGSSGFRLGLVHSLNESFIKAYNNLNAPHMVSNYTQWTFQEVLSDHDFMADYIRKNQAALTESYVLVVKYLRAANVPYVPSRGSLFVWIDLSAFLKDDSVQAETDLWLEIYQKAKLLITPANGFGHQNRGHYRLVYTAISKTGLEEAMSRLSDFIKNKR